MANVFLTCSTGTVSYFWDSEQVRITVSVSYVEVDPSVSGSVYFTGVMVCDCVITNNPRMKANVSTPILNLLPEINVSFYPDN